MCLGGHRASGGTPGVCRLVSGFLFDSLDQLSNPPQHAGLGLIHGRNRHPQRLRHLGCSPVLDRHGPEGLQCAVFELSADDVHGPPPYLVAFIDLLLGSRFLRRLRDVEQLTLRRGSAFPAGLIALPAKVVADPAPSDAPQPCPKAPSRTVPTEVIHAGRHGGKHVLDDVSSVVTIDAEVAAPAVNERSVQLHEVPPGGRVTRPELGQKSGRSRTDRTGGGTLWRIVRIAHRAEKDSSEARFRDRQPRAALPPAAIGRTEAGPAGSPTGPGGAVLRTRGLHRLKV